MAPSIRRPDRLLYAAILLPCLALGALALSLHERDEALALKRSLEDRQRLGSEVSRALVDQLAGVIASELSVAPVADYVEEPTAFVASLSSDGVTLPAERAAHTRPQDAAVVRRLNRNPETINTLRGALGEPRIVAHDSGRYLVAARFTDGARGQLVGVRTLALARAAGVALGDSLRFVPAAVPGAVQLGDGLDGLYLVWTRPPSPPMSWLGTRLYYVLSIALVALLGVLIGHFAARDVRREADATRLRQHFVAGVSHELKTPLTAIRVMAETLHDRDLPAAARQEYLATMVGETGRLSRLVDNVVEFTRLENGERVYRIRQGDLAAVVRRAAHALGYSLEKDGFQLSVRCPASLDGVRLDDDAIEQVLLNLLANAAKYSGDSRDIEIGVRENGQEVDVSVRDFGIGIDAAEHSRIFDRFYRSPRVAREIPGTGLGLTLARHIVTAHGGRLTVDSRLGEGSVFHMHLPRSRAS